jgi:hypothetical protein
MVGKFTRQSTGGCRRVLCLGIGVLAVFAASASPAWASCTNQVYDTSLPVSSSTPANGASLAPANGISWEVVTLHGLLSFSVRVATQSTLGNDGTLSTLNAVDQFPFIESNTYGYYTGYSAAGGIQRWSNTPGLYYWQAFGEAETVDSNTGALSCTLYASPVYTITIAAPQPQGPNPPITDDDSLRATLTSFGPKIVEDENAVKKGLAGYPKGKVRPLTRALQHEVGDLHALESRLSQESPSSPAGAQAKTDILQGLGLIASAYSALRHDVLAAHGGPVPLAQVTVAVNRDKQGRKKFQAGLKLLGA